MKSLELTPFQFGPFQGKRRVTWFGWRYDYGEHKLIQAAESPGWLQPFIPRIEAFGSLAPDSIRQVLCTEYEAGSGIGWHRDKPHFEEVFGLSLASPCRFRFRRRVARRMGTPWFRSRPALSLYVVGSLPPRVGAQHPAGDRAAILHYLPQHGRDSAIQRPGAIGFSVATLETIKGLAEAITGRSRPTTGAARKLVRSRKAHLFRFRDDGFVPNHPWWPLIIYRGTVRLPEEFDPAAVFEQLFAGHGWGRSWRNGVYEYVHYHSRIHEVLGVARGRGTVRFGGDDGRKIELKAGDVAILPAGTGHQALAASEDFLVVGAYPPKRKLRPVPPARRSREGDRDDSKRRPSADRPGVRRQRSPDPQLENPTLRPGGTVLSRQGRADPCSAACRQAVFSTSLCSRRGHRATRHCRGCNPGSAD